MTGPLPVDGAKVIKEGWPNAVGGVHGSIAISDVADSVSCSFRAPSCVSA